MNKKLREAAEIISNLCDHINRFSNNREEAGRLVARAMGFRKDILAEPAPKPSDDDEYLIGGGG